jgi:hypothetical protein
MICGVAVLALPCQALESRATDFSQLQILLNRAEGEAYDHDFHGNGPDTGDVVYDGNPADLILDAGGAHAELHGDYSVSDSVLTLHGSTQGMAVITGGSSTVGGGDSTFYAKQDFGADIVQLHVVGSLTRIESDDNDSSTVGLGIGSFNYGQGVGPGSEGTSFDDVITVSGVVDFYINAHNRPYNGFGSFTGTETYDVTISIVPEPSCFLLAALGMAGLIGQWRLTARRFDW